MQAPAVLRLFLLAAVDELEIVLVVARDYTGCEGRPIGKVAGRLDIGIKVRSSDRGVCGEHGNAEMIDGIGGEIRLKNAGGMAGGDEMEDGEVASRQKEQRCHL